MILRILFVFKCIETPEGRRSLDGVIDVTLPGSARGGSEYPNVVQKRTVTHWLFVDREYHFGLAGFLTNVFLVFELVVDVVRRLRLHTVRVFSLGLRRDSRFPVVSSRCRRDVVRSRDAVGRRRSRVVRRHHVWRFRGVCGRGRGRRVGAVKGRGLVRPDVVGRFVDQLFDDLLHHRLDLIEFRQLIAVELGRVDDVVRVPRLFALAAAVRDHSFRVRLGDDRVVLRRPLVELATGERRAGGERAFQSVAVPGRVRQEIVVHGAIRAQQTVTRTVAASLHARYYEQPFG